MSPSNWLLPLSKNICFWRRSERSNGPFFGSKTMFWYETPDSWDKTSLFADWLLTYALSLQAMHITLLPDIQNIQWSKHPVIGKQKTRTWRDKPNPRTRRRRILTTTSHIHLHKLKSQKMDHVTVKLLISSSKATPLNMRQLLTGRTTCLLKWILLRRRYSAMLRMEKRKKVHKYKKISDVEFQRFDYFKVTGRCLHCTWQSQHPARPQWRQQGAQQMQRRPPSCWQSAGVRLGLRKNWKKKSGN